MLITVVQPVKLHFKILMLKFVRKKTLSQNETYSPNIYDTNKRIEKCEKKLTRHVRLQLGLETTFQLTGNAILLLFAYSYTKTNQGLTAFFETSSIDILGFNITPRVVIAFLLVMNLLGYIRAHFNGIVVGYASNYNLVAKLLLLLSILCSSIAGILSKILYFSPPLGLFNLLHHYQGTHRYIGMIIFYLTGN